MSLADIRRIMKALMLIFVAAALIVSGCSSEVRQRGSVYRMKTTRDVAARLRDLKVRASVARADAIVLSIGANDLFERPGAREEAIRDPFNVAERILDRVSGVVHELRAINPSAEILILGGYNPVPHHEYAFLIEQYLGLWDRIFAREFESDSRIAVVRMSDIVTGPQRLSRLDHFHPGADAYRDTARRIAAMLVPQRAAWTLCHPRSAKRDEGPPD